MDSALFNYFINPYADNKGQPSHDITIVVPDARCNLSCEYCYLNNCEPSNRPVFLREKVLSRLSPYVDQHGQVKIWCGEPLYNKEIFIEICDFINECLPGYSVFIYTNGILLNDWWADFFKEHKVNIFLSHDGPGQKYRGLDYFKLDSQRKAIKKIYDNNNLLGINSVIHKQNCSFFSITNYFNNIERELGITFDKRTQTLVGATLENNLPLDFDFMDKDLINYIQESISFLLKELLSGDKNGYSKKWFGWDTIKSYFPIIQALLGLSEAKVSNCNKSSMSQLSVSSTGQCMCVYQAYSGASLTKACSLGKEVGVPKKCASCEIFKGCPIKGCQKLSLDSAFCKKVIARYKTIEFAIIELFKQVGFDAIQSCKVNSKNE